MTWKSRRRFSSTSLAVMMSMYQSSASMPGILLGDPVEILEEAAVGRLDDVGLGDAGDPGPAVLLGVLEGQPADPVGARGR